VDRPAERTRHSSYARGRSPFGRTDNGNSAASYRGERFFLEVPTLIPISRAALLGAGSAVALVGMPLMTQLVEAATRADADDISALNAQIELERAGIKAYADAGATGLLDAPLLAVAGRFASDHVAHREALAAAVVAAGGTPSQQTVALAYPSLATKNDVLEFALTVERKAASTYLSIVSDFKDRKLAELVASILGVETTHVALLANALGKTAYSSAFVG
jgi:bacterioferritin (cytochrome b1)